MGYGLLVIGYWWQLTNAQCPMPNAQCPMPNAQCPMPDAQKIKLIPVGCVS